MGKKIRLKISNRFKDRTPVQRQHSAEYLLITLISFTTSVGGTRLFLEITGSLNSVVVRSTLPMCGGENSFSLSLPCFH